MPGSTDPVLIENLAWPEVEFADVGWVPFNPIPEGEDASATTGGQAVAPVSERPDDVPPTVPPPVPSTVPPLPEELQDEIGFTDRRQSLAGRAVGRLDGPHQLRAGRHETQVVKTVAAPLRRCS